MAAGHADICIDQTHPECDDCESTPVTVSDVTTWQVSGRTGKRVYLTTDGAMLTAPALLMLVEHLQVLHRAITSS